MRLKRLPSEFLNDEIAQAFESNNSQELGEAFDRVVSGELSLVAKWLAFTAPEVHEAFLNEFYEADSTKQA